MQVFFKDLSQISELAEPYVHKYPKYNKSTTDPTYYEPAATRIANMKKASGVQLEGVYDFYNKSDVEKFNESNFKQNIDSVNVDPRFNNNLLREEISQITNDLGYKVEDKINKKKVSAEEKRDRINDILQIKQMTEKPIQDNNTEEK